jgi:hypothetical protein
MKGKCWIYKRATLYLPNEEPKIVDYSNGTECFNVDDKDIVFRQGHYPSYMWNLPGETVPITLNVPYTDKSVNSIFLNGVLPYGSGELRWECLFGKYKPLHLYYYDKLKELMPILIILFIVYYFYKKTGF